jgi:hypothetical protein
LSAGLVLEQIVSSTYSYGSRQSWNDGARQPAHLERDKISVLCAGNVQHPAASNHRWNQAAFEHVVNN